MEAERTMVEIDARGLACPQPVLMTKKAIEDGADAVKVTVDNEPASGNVSRFLASKGFSAAVTPDGANFIVSGAKNEAAAPCACEPAAPAAAVKKAVFISHATIGGNDAELGEVLMKAFLGTLTQYDDSERPEVIALMNEGVKLAVKGTSSAETLADFAAKGGKVLVCGTCLKHFGLMDSLGAGVVSNMFEIASALLAHQTLTL